MVFLFYATVYYFKCFKAKAKTILHTEAKLRFILSNNLNNKLNEGTHWSMGITVRKDKNY